MENPKEQPVEVGVKTEGVYFDPQTGGNVQFEYQLERRQDGDWATLNTDLLTKTVSDKNRLTSYISGIKSYLRAQGLHVEE